MKYNIGEIYIMGYDFGLYLKEDDLVKIVGRRKIGSNTYVDVVDINNQTTANVPVKKLNKRIKLNSKIYSHYIAKGKVGTGCSKKKQSKKRHKKRRNKKIVASVTDK